MKMKRLISSLLVIGLSVSLFVGCKAKGGTDNGEKESNGGDKSFTQVKESGELKIGLCPEYPPFESVNASGEIEGFDPTLATAMAETLGVKPKFINTPWEGLIAGLNNGEFDVIMSAMSPEEATAATDAVSLSKEYYELGDIIAVRADESEIKSKEDLKDKTIGVQTGSASEQAANKLEGMGIKVKAINPYNRNSDAFSELENGRIDAVVVGIAYAATQSKENSNIKIINDPIQNCGVVVVAKKDAVELTNKINEAIEATKSNGSYEKAVSQWLSIK